MAVGLLKRRTCDEKKQNVTSPFTAHATTSFREADHSANQKGVMLRGLGGGAVVVVVMLRVIGTVQKRPDQLFCLQRLDASL